MSPPPNDAGHPSENKVSGGLAGVFKGLTVSKLNKTHSHGTGLPTTATTSTTMVAAPLPSTVATVATALSAPSISSTRTSSGPTDSDSLQNHSRGHLEIYAECFERLKNGTLSERAAAADILCTTIDELPAQSMSDVWHAALDLIDPGNPQIARLSGWELLAECAKHPFSTNLERKNFFHAITAPAESSDFYMQLSALINLTSSGRDLSGFDYEVFPILTAWFGTAFNMSRVNKNLTAVRSSSRNGKSVKVKGVQTREERDLALLFEYAIDIIKYSSKIASDSAMGGILKAIFGIAMSTSAEEDLVASIAVINTCVTVGAMPGSSLERCVKVLSSIYCLVPTLQKTAWPVLANIFKSHHGLHTISILIETLRNYPPAGVDVKDATREVRGALVVLQKLVRKAGSTEYPMMPFTLIVDGLENVIAQAPSPRIVALILQLVNQLLDGGDGVINLLLRDEDWSPMLAVAATCAKRSTPFALYDETATSRLPQSDSTESEEPGQKILDRQSAILTARMESLLRGMSNERLEYMQRSSCVSLLADVHAILSDSGAELVLKHYAEYSCCFPSDPHWYDNLCLILDAFYTNQSRSAVVRLQALQIAIDVHSVLELTDGGIDNAPDAVANLIRRILGRMGQERDNELLSHAVSFAVSTAPSAGEAIFSLIFESFNSVIQNDERRQPLALATSGTSAPVSPLSPSGVRPDMQVDQSTSYIATRGLICIFMDTMNSDANKARQIFDVLISITRDKRCPVDARLSAMKLLFHLRADWANRIFVVSNTESEGLAAVLYRTDASLQRKSGEDVTQEILAIEARNERGTPSPPPQATRTSRGVSFSHSGGSSDRTEIPQRTASGARHKMSKLQYRQLWNLPDPDALPQTPLANASTVLFSHDWSDRLAGLGAEKADMVEAASKSKSSTPDATADSPTLDSVRDKGQASGIATEPPGAAALVMLNMTAWMEVIFDILTKGSNWELYSFALVHLPSQLSNHAVCRGTVPVILRIRAELCEQSRMNTYQEPPVATGLRRPDVQTCVLQILTMILSYHEYFQRQEGDDLVRTFITGLTDKNPISCVHALSICCYELPHATSKSLVTILQKMSQIITRPGVAVHILELLACLSRLPWLYSNFREDEYRIAFGVCFRYLQAVRDRRKSSRVSHTSISEQETTSSSNKTWYGMGAFDSHGPEFPGSAQPLRPGISDDVPQYVYALAYHVLLFWFLALRVTDRASYVTWIASRLFIDNDGRQITDEQAQITLDFMQRVAFTDTDTSAPADDPDDEGQDSATLARSWIMGNSIITIQPSISRPGFARITKRQPSSTSYYTIQENLQPPPPHQARGIFDTMDSLAGQVHHSQAATPVFPSHLLANLLAPVPQQIDSPLWPIPLPNDDDVDRAIRTFDRNSTVDGHKVGVIFIGDGQSDEVEILANISGSSDYVEFLNGLGTLVRLKGATFNTQGLDRSDDQDGAYTFCWRDRVTEMVFHVTTQMPTDLEHDPLCINKKRHIGNDFVNIIFNDSGLPFRFDTFPSEFNYVNIVITPESRASFVARRELSLQKLEEDEQKADSQEHFLLQQQQQQQQQHHQQKEQQRQEQKQEQKQVDDQQERQLPPPPPPPQQMRTIPFYKVQVMSKPGFPEISPAARTKIISLKALPDFIRLLALNASVFSQVWASRQRGEHISSWRSRLRQVQRLRERYGPTHAMATATPSMSTMPAGGTGGTAGAGASSGGGGVGLGMAGAGVGAGAGLAGSGANAANVGGPSLGSGKSSVEQLTRTSVSGMRDSFNSLRRASAATFFTTGGDINSHRTSIHSATTASDSTETTAANGILPEAWVDSLDFSKWT